MGIGGLYLERSCRTRREPETEFWGIFNIYRISRKSSQQRQLRRKLSERWEGNQKGGAKGQNGLQCDVQQRGKQGAD